MSRLPVSSAVPAHIAERISDEESATREVTDELIGTVVVVAVLLFSVVWYFGVSQ